MYTNIEPVDEIIERLNDFVERETAQYLAILDDILTRPYNDFETYGGFIDIFLEDYDLSAFFKHTSKIDLLSKYRGKYESDIEHFLLDITLTLYYEFEMQSTERNITEIDPYDEFEREDIASAYFFYMSEILRPYGKRVVFEYKLSGENNALEYYIKLYDVIHACKVRP